MGADKKRLIVVSAVNFTEGGSLSVMQDCLSAAHRHLGSEYRILAFVHRAALFDCPGVEFMEIPRAKSSWLLRIFYEYAYFRRLSRRLRPYLWFSLHDMTPNVHSTRQAVYCHNPAPFFTPSLRQAFMEPTLWLFSKLYGSLYRFNIRANDFVVVQQEWIRKEFRRRYGVQNVVVAHPAIGPAPVPAVPLPSTDGKFTFIFPAFPRVFKNFEVIGSAAELLEAEGYHGARFQLTVSGTENRYARWIKRRFKNVRSVEFIGPQTRQRVFELYARADCLIFPSLLETWGLPITEFRQFNKPILAADLAYAHETGNQYQKIRFFDPKDPIALASLIKETIAGRGTSEPCNTPEPSFPYVSNWEGLFDLLLNADVNADAQSPRSQ